MARPRKDGTVAGADERLVEAFWDLLEEMPVRDVSVGALARRAGCNRGTFYYHFPSLDELVSRAVLGEVAGRDRFLERMAKLACGATEQDYARVLASPSAARIALLVERGGRTELASVAMPFAMGMWTELLAPGGTLEPEAAATVAFMINGLVGMLTGARSLPVPPGCDRRAAAARMAASCDGAVRLLLSEACRAQGADEAVVRARLRSLDLGRDGGRRR